MKSENSSIAWNYMNNVELRVNNEYCAINSEATRII